MGLGISDDHVALASTVGRFLDRHCPPSVARAGLDSEGEEVPSFWAELAGTGWLGLHVAEGYGGSGYGLAEMAVVLEEMGRAAAPGPFLPTVLAAALISAGGDREAAEQWLPDLAAGQAIGSVAFPANSPLTGSGRDAGGGLTVTGTVRPVLSAAMADVLVAPVLTAEGEVWSVFPLRSADVEELPSLDPTRRVASVRLDGQSVPAGSQLTLGREEAGWIVAALVGAECAGLAAWCTDTASEYAKVRVQFGRPIGQFQAVKHRCAGMLASVERIRAAAWDAAAAWDETGGTPAADGDRLAGAISGAVAARAAQDVAEDCIQVLGGIGFTWEHDAHRYLRRAATLALLMGGPGRWHQRIAQLALAGARRQMGRGSLVDGVAGDGITGAGGDTGRRDRIRSEVEAVATRPPAERRVALVESGLMVPHWPPPWGREAAAAEQLIIDEELERAGIHRPNLAVGAWAAPTIVAHGTPDQQQRWVGPTLLGEISWCQLFSEPGAGSDLASLTTRAVRAPGGWSLTGQKVWTTMAREADWGICLARTDPDAPKHAGISYFVVDMRDPGLDIRPLRELTGMAMFNEVFLDGVFVPDDCLVGPVHGGWSLARTTLANERVAMGSGSSFGGGMEALLGLIADTGADHLDAVALDQLGRLLADAHCLAVMGRRSAHRAVSGAAPGPESSVRKLLGVEHDQRTQAFGLGLLGPDGAAADGRGGQWTFGYLANRCLTIAGGTSEVQRNVIGERLLGLPRDPEPAG